MSDTSACYVGVTACGCAVAAMIEDMTDKREAAKEVAEWIRDGLTVESHDVLWVRANLKPCVHRSPKRAKGDTATKRQPEGSEKA